MDFKLIESKNVFSGKVIKVWRERVEYPDGREVSIELLKHPGSIAILSLDDDGKIWFVRQYRHPSGGLLLELPAGTLEPDEAPEVTALREIREEIGMAASVLTPVGGFYLAPGYSTEFMHLYLATGLSPDPLTQDEGEFIQVEKYSIKDVYQMLDRGEFADVKTVAFLGLMRPRFFDQTG